CATVLFCFFFQAEDGIRDRNVTGVQTCALPISFSTLNYAHRPGMAAWLNDYSKTFAAQHDDAIHSATFFPEPGVEDMVEQVLERSEERRVGKDCGCRRRRRQEQKKGRRRVGGER